MLKLLIIGLVVLAGILVGTAYSQESANKEANKSASNAEKSNGGSKPFYYFRIATYSGAMSAYCTTNSEDKQAEWRKKFICDSKITDVVIAFFTFFLSIFTFGLVRVGMRQDKTARQHLRAFVTVDTGRILNVAPPINLLPGYTPTGAEIIAPNVGPLAQLSIKNSGSTPAFEVLHWSNMHFAEFPLQSMLPERQAAIVMARGAIAPGGITTKAVRLENPLTAFQIVALRSATAAIYVYGEISYRDTFRRKRQTHYLMTHNNGSGAVGISTDLTIGDALGKTT